MSKHRAGKQLFLSSSMTYVLTSGGREGGKIAGAKAENKSCTAKWKGGDEDPDEIG